MDEEEDLFGDSDEEATTSAGIHPCSFNHLHHQTFSPTRYACFGYRLNLIILQLNSDSSISGGKKPAPVSAEERKWLFRKELRSMMYGFGDDKVGTYRLLVNP